MEKLLVALEQSLAQTEAAVGAAGPGPVEKGSGYRLPETVAEREALRAVVQEGLAALAANGRGHYPPKEPQARRMKCEGRTRFAYNAQAVINRTGRIVVAAEVTEAEGDEGQLVGMVEQARANTGQEEAVTVADTAYGNGKDLAAAAAAKLSVISPVKEGGRRAACCGKSKARMIEIWPHTAVVQAQRAKLAGAGRKRR
jgi:hypothetical protein